MFISKLLTLVFFSLLIIATAFMVAGCGTVEEVVDEIDPVEEKIDVVDSEYKKEEINNGLVIMLPPTAGNLEASPRGDYLLFTMAAAPIDPYHIIHTETYEGEICDDWGIYWGEVEALVSPGMDPAQIYFSDFSADGAKLLYISYKFEGYDAELRDAAIYLANLGLPPDIYHQVQLDSEEIVGGIRPVWKANNEDIYYLTIKGVMSYSPAEQQAEKIYSASDLSGLVQDNNLAPHSFNVENGFAELAYFHEGKINLVALENDKSRTEVIDTEIDRINVNLEYIFGGRYLVIESDSRNKERYWLSFLERETGNLIKVTEDYLSPYSWNDQEELVFFEDRNNPKLTLLDGNLEKVSSIGISLPWRSVIWLDDMWCVLGSNHEGYPLYKVDFE